PCRDDVVRHRLHRIRLEHRDVLVGGGVEDDLWVMALEHVAHLRRVAAVGQDGDHGGETAFFDGPAPPLVQPRLCPGGAHAPLGAEPAGLAAELRPDRAAAAGHQHDPIPDVRRDRLEVDLDLLAPEDVLDRDRPDLTGEVDVAGDELVQPRQRLDGDALTAGRLDDLAAHLARSGRHRDQDLVGPVLADEPPDLVGRPEHGHPVDADVLLARVVVDEPDRRVGEPAVALHLAYDELAGVAGPDDQDLAAPGDDPAGRALDQRPSE